MPMSVCGPLTSAPFTAIRTVVVPQAVRVVIPPVTNDFIALFKDTSVCSVILITELTRKYNELYNFNRDLVVQLALTSGCLYCGGMVWNDFFDRADDAKTRPNRPIPSGRIRIGTAAVTGIALFAIGGFRLVLWGIFLRTVVGLHVTWLVNSVSHMWGSRPFATRDASTNNWWLALLSFGDGWHNNHHAYPVSARHGLKWHEIDFNWYTIWIFKQLGLARHIHEVQLPARTYANQN